MRPDYGSNTIVSNVVEQLLHDGSKELAQSDTDSAKYVLSNENKVWIPFLTLVYNTAFLMFNFITWLNMMQKTWLSGLLVFADVGSLLFWFSL